MTNQNCVEQASNRDSRTERPAKAVARNPESDHVNDGEGCVHSSSMNCTTEIGSVWT